MTTQNRIQQLAANWRAKNGNETRKSYIKPGYIGFDGIKADDVRQEVIRQSELSDERTNNQKRPSVSNFVKNIWKEKLSKIAKALPDQGYSMGGEVIVNLVTPSGKRIASGYYENMQEYARSSRHRATHGEYRISISLTDLHSAQIIGGLVTFTKEPVDNHVNKAEWIESEGSKQYFKTIRKSGFITKNYHAESYEEAIEWRKRQAKRLAATRTKVINEHLAKEKAKKMFYGFKHARQAGLCSAGINQFAKDYKLNTEYGYRGDILLKIASQNGRYSFVKNMINERARKLAL